jgi:hypothetical protein
MKIKAPWKDYEGKDIFDGNIIRHPDGTEGVVKLIGVQTWRVDYGGGKLSRLSLQIGNKGQAVVINRQQNSQMVTSNEKEPFMPKQHSTKQSETLKSVFDMMRRNSNRLQLNC